MARSGHAAGAEQHPAVEWRDGVHLHGTVLWCDARRARDLCFLSSARVSSRSRHGKVLASARTIALLEALHRERHALPGETLGTPFARPFSLGAARLELFPSGQLPGAASLLALPTGPRGRGIVYAGEVDPQSALVGALAEPMELRGAEVLVIRAPLARLDGARPPRAEARAALVAAVQGALDEGHPPVVLADALGVAEEAAAALARAGIGICAHPRIAASLAAYRALGLDVPLPQRRAARSSGASLPSGSALLWPIDLPASPALERLRAPVRIAITGLAIDPAFAGSPAGRQLRADRAIALADSCDRAELCEYVRQTGAREVYLTEGYSDAVAAALKAAGARRIEPLGPPRQMELLAGGA